ncbi:hypothetical protein D3C76_1850250 [compost metagenome]
MVEVASAVVSFSWMMAVPTASGAVAPPVRPEIARLKLSEDSARASLIRLTRTVLAVSPMAKARLPVRAT